MKSLKSTRSPADTIRDLERLDLSTLRTRFSPPRPAVATPGRQRQPPVKVATVATIRSLLVTFGETNTLMASLAHVNDIKLYCDFRTRLVERVLPAVLDAFEFCKETLSLGGATDSPVAANLAKVANQLCDSMELVQTRIEFAVEYSETLRILQEIRSFSEQEPFTEAQIAPLVFSITESLPMRLNTFITYSEPYFPDSAKRLSRLGEQVINDIRRRIDKFRAAQLLEQQLEEEEKRKQEQRLQSKKARRGVELPSSSSSPLATRVPTAEPRHRPPPMRVLRGVRYRERLSGTHQRIPSLKEVEQEEARVALLKHNDSPDKENPIGHAQKRRTESKPTLALSNTTYTAAKPSRLKPPTRIENRRVSDPLTREQTQDVTLSEPQVATRRVRRMPSRIAQPTEIATRKRVRDMHEARRSGDSSLTMFDRSGMLLSSPETSLMNDTPLARRGVRQAQAPPKPTLTSHHLPQTPGQGIHVARRRPLRDVNNNAGLLAARTHAAPIT